MKTAQTTAHTPDLHSYSGIVAAGLILPRKAKYTMHDIRSVLVDSLFRQGGRTFTPTEARAIVRCSAHFHETDCSKTVENFQNP